MLILYYYYYIYFYMITIIIDIVHLVRIPNRITDPGTYYYADYIIYSPIYLSIYNLFNFTLSLWSTEATAAGGR